LQVRDVLAWARFIADTARGAGEEEGGRGRLEVHSAYVHGAYLTLLDGIGLGLGLNEMATQEVTQI
jgi:midasin